MPSQGKQVKVWQRSGSAQTSFLSHSLSSVQVAVWQRLPKVEHNSRKFTHCPLSQTQLKQAFDWQRGSCPEPFGTLTIAHCPVGSQTAAWQTGGSGQQTPAQQVNGAQSAKVRMQTPGSPGPAQVAVTAKLPSQVGSPQGVPAGA
jgi:hypothetical protein